ncbi:MAG: tetratricopeptide repeat protein [Candidatus Brocadiia bacterium]
MKKACFIILLSVAFVILAVSFGTKAYSDTVKWSPDGGKTYKEETGDVLNETYDEIEMKSGAGTKKIKQKDVQSTTYAKQPPQMDEALRAMQQGDYNKAMEIYRKLLSDPGMRSIFKQQIAYSIALCLQQSQKFDDAIQEYDKLLKDVPQTKYYREICINKAKCALGKGDSKAAIEMLDKARLDVVKFDEKFAFEMDLLKGRIEIDDKKFSAAKATFSKVAGGAGSKYPSAADKANVGLGQCLVIEGDYDTAEKAFVKVIENSKDTIALAGAYNGRGDCYFNKAKKSKDRELYKKAIRDNYLKAKVMYPAPEGEATYEYEKSLYFSGYCYEILSQYPPPEKKQVYTEQAKALYNELIKYFPNSTFRKDAEERLKGIKAS